MSLLKCHIVRDLLPLYVDGLCSEDTAMEVAQHLRSCRACKDLYEEMNSEMSVSLATPEFEEKKIFRHVQKKLLAIMAALLVTAVCLMLNMSRAWQGDPADVGNLLVTGVYILFWSIFSYASRKYLPLVRFSEIISALTLFSSVTGMVFVLTQSGGFVAALLSILAAVPFYGLYFYTSDWALLYGAAGVCSMVWLLYSLSVRRKIQSVSESDGTGISKLFTKKRLILTMLFFISLMPMLLNQYGGRRDVQEISGLVNLFNPIGCLSAAAFLLGVWGRFNRAMWNQILGLTGTVGIVISELYEFFTWHIATITGQFSLHNSIRFAFPEFYVGLLFSGAMIVAYVLIDKKMRD